MIFSLFIVLFSFVWKSSLCMEIQGKINVDKHRSNIKVSLNGDQYYTLTKADGSFTFYNIPNGIYLLDVLSNEYMFSQLKLKVSEDTETVSVVEYKYPGATRTPGIYPISLSPHVQQNYYHKKEGFSLYKTVMGNPMMVMMIVMGGAFVLFPNMLTVDKEQLKEMQKLNGGDEDPMNALKKMLSGGDSKGNDEDDD